ncbi:MAG: leucyl/phenylalanyl-tRNA--protein transferase [Balneolaceae bacterium]
MKYNPSRIIPPELLIQAYKRGYFPMSESRNDESFEWYTARKRGIIPIDRFHVSSNVHRLIRQGRYTARANTSFREVMEHCAGRDSTWISELLIDSYEVLHHQGYAHSIEIFDASGSMVGGQYGVSVGAAFFGESMFKSAKEADKIALYYTHWILEKNGFELWDTQFFMDHLAQFGCIEIPAEEYRKKLNSAIKKNAIFTFPASPKK